ncbi:unnamed protein product [Caenorhabditis sp. 36 PRJEB53466]|nr:unnamed protein product [Caenorhabditis sp. 36 PRJEB53466]
MAPDATLIYFFSDPPTMTIMEALLAAFPPLFEPDLHGGYVMEEDNNEIEIDENELLDAIAKAHDPEDWAHALGRSG